MSAPIDAPAHDRLAAIRAAFPPEGLFADKDWLLSPEPFVIDAKLAEQLHKLGYRLHLFVRACNELYQRSVAGKQPRWIAAYLDRGKPPELVAYSRQRRFRDDLPQVIRPDLVLTEPGPDGHPGFTIAELDNVPGGIGLTHWLNATYASFGTHDILGGASGMLDGFRAILGGGPADIIVSEEAATYRPEMRYLARLSSGALRVHDAASFTQPSTLNPQPPLYRFFELFDLANVPCAAEIMASQARVTPPFKPYLEEKMWFALFWLRPLRDFWRRELGARHFLALQRHIPYTWIVDPAPLPQHAVIPGFEIHAWEELKHFSQKQRDLILKISGFSELGWGSRSVTLGSDAPQPEWQAAIEHALESFAHHPYILQRFHKGRLLEQPFLNPATDTIETMPGRVRLCPYYFLIKGKAELRGALATICPADKKLLHGMKDAIMVPTAVAAG